jgi:uncharacterized protein (DUF2132 family)
MRNQHNTHGIKVERILRDSQHIQYGRESWKNRNTIEPCFEVDVPLST